VVGAEVTTKAGFPDSYQGEVVHNAGRKGERSNLSNCYRWRLKGSDGLGLSERPPRTLFWPRARGLRYARLLIGAIGG
jgi:hypothetical protein